MSTLVSCAGREKQNVANHIRELETFGFFDVQLGMRIDLELSVRQVSVLVAGDTCSALIPPGSYTISYRMRMTSHPKVMCTTEAQLTVE